MKVHTNGSLNQTISVVRQAEAQLYCLLLQLMSAAAAGINVTDVNMQHKRNTMKYKLHCLNWICHRSAAFPAK